MQPPIDTIPASSPSAPSAAGRSSRAPRRRLVWLATVGVLLAAAALAIRISPGGRTRALSPLSSHSLTLLALERPKDPLVFQWLGTRLYEEGDLPGSIQAVGAAKHVEPRLEAAELGLGTAPLAAGQPHAAQRSLVRASELAPKDSRPHSKLADLYGRYRNSSSTVQP